MMVLQTSLVLSVSLFLCSGARLPRQSSDDDGDEGISLPNTDICGLSPVLSPKIMGGRPAKPKEFPWMAALGYENFISKKFEWNCGGSLITDQHVLTAAHCVDPYSIRNMKLTKVRLGELDLNEDVQDGAQPQDIAVDNVVVHGSYDSFRKINDVAIIKIKEKVTFTDFIRPICLAPEVFKLKSFEGFIPSVAGWGVNSATKKETRETHLMVVELEIKSQDYCRKRIPIDKVLGNQTIDSRNICAFSSNKDACEGDSGGPLMQSCVTSVNNDYDPNNESRTANYYLMGIVSFGPACDNQSVPGVYTNVSSFMSWIYTNLNK